MKKKILSFVLAICLILPFGFMLSGCTTKEDKSPSNVVLETIQNDFGDAMGSIQHTFNNAKSFFENGFSLYIEYSFADGWQRPYSMSVTSTEVCVRNIETNEVLSNRNINESASQYEMTEDALEKVVDTFYSFKFAYYNGYLIHLSTGEWEKIAYDNYENDTIFFFENYLDLYTGYLNFVQYSTSTSILKIGPSENNQDIYSIKI